MDSFWQNSTGYSRGMHRSYCLSQEELSWVRSCSNWLMPALMVKSIFPCGVVVSSLASFNDRMSAPQSLIFSMSSNRSLVERLILVNSQARTMSLSRRASSILFNSGCPFLVPVTFS